MKFKSIAFSLLLIPSLILAEGKFKIKDELFVGKSAVSDMNIGFITDQSQDCVEEYSGFFRAKDSAGVEVCNWTPSSANWVSVGNKKEYYRAALYKDITLASSVFTLDLFATTHIKVVEMFPSPFPHKIDDVANSGCIKLTRGTWRIIFMPIASVKEIPYVYWQNGNGDEIGTRGYSSSNMLGTPAEAIVRITGNSEEFCIKVLDDVTLRGSSILDGSGDFSSWDGPTSYFSVEKIEIY